MMQYNINTVTNTETPFYQPPNGYEGIDYLDPCDAPESLSIQYFSP